MTSTDEQTLALIEQIVCVATDAGDGVVACETGRDAAVAVPGKKFSVFYCSAGG
jgi:hypothetical protein